MCIKIKICIFWDGSILNLIYVIETNFLYRKKVLNILLLTADFAEDIYIYIYIYIYAHFE